LIFIKSDSLSISDGTGLNNTFPARLQANRARHELLPIAPMCYAAFEIFVLNG
jgi:hypothetical protein